MNKNPDEHEAIGERIVEARSTSEAAGTTSHTESPWEWEPQSPWILNSPSQSTDGSRMSPGSAVLMLSRRQRGTLDDADARLIAAAPEMLEALKHMLHVFDEYLPKGIAAEIACKKARAAVDKAQGKSASAAPTVTNRS